MLAVASHKVLAALLLEKASCSYASTSSTGTLPLSLTRALSCLAWMRAMQTAHRLAAP